MFEPHCNSQLCFSSGSSISISKLCFHGCHRRFLSESRPRSYPASPPEADVYADLQYNPEVLVAQMPLLTSLRFEGPWPDRLDKAPLHMLQHLARLEISQPQSEEVLKGLFRAPNLTGLVLGNCCLTSTWPNDAQAMLTALSSSNLSALQSLALPVPAGAVQHLSMLSSLTALSSLHARVQEHDRSADLMALASLKGLVSLQLEIAPQTRISSLTVTAAVFSSLTPLSALSGLTLLDLKKGWEEIPLDVDVTAGISVILHLTALRVVRCHIIQTDVFDDDSDDDDQLPAQLHFLSTATGLEELDLKVSDIEVIFRRSEAIHKAVASLSALKRVTIQVEDVSGHYTEPLYAFAAAPQLKSCPS